MANTASVLPSAFREGFAVNIAPVHSSRNDTASISGTVSGVASLNIVALESVTVWNISQSKRIRGNHAAFGDGLRRNDDGLRGNRQSHALQGREYGKSGAQRSK